MHEAAIEADGKRQIRPRQFVLVQLAALGEHGLLRAELALQPFASCQSVQPHGVRVEWAAEGRVSASHFALSP